MVCIVSSDQSYWHLTRIPNKLISRNILTDPADSESLAGNYVTSLFEAHDGTIWIGTYGNGICKYTENENGGSFINYTQQNGLCNNVAYGIEEDTEGNLWISTDNGLSKFDPV